MLKTKVKILITLLAVFVVMCLLNVGTVQATTEKDLQTMLNILPSEMSLDITEVEYQNAPTLVKQKVKDIWETNNISTQNIEVDTDPICIYDMDAIYSVNVEVKSSSVSKYKTISIKYNNTDKKNKTDEEVVKNLKIENKNYFEVDLDYKNKYDGNPQGLGEWFDNYIAQYYTDMINDNSIVVKAITGSGTGEGINLYTAEHGTDIGIFKNGILYEIRNIGHHAAIPVINVADTMTDTEINNYVVKSIKDTYSDYGQYVTSITKGVEYSEEYNKIPNIYTVNTSAGPSSLVILKKYKSTESKLQEILDSIPDTMMLDIPEVEFKKATDLVGNNIKKILDTNDIKYEETEKLFKLKDLTIDGYDIVIYYEASGMHIDVNEFHTAHIEITTTDGNTIFGNEQTKRKDVKLVYNNHNNYNETDEQYVKNLAIRKNPSFITYDFDKVLKDGFIDASLREIENYYKSKINDSTITVVANSGECWGNWIDSFGFHSVNLAIFKNDILYDIVAVGKITMVWQVIIPSNVENIEDYALTKIKSYMKEALENEYEFVESITLEKVNTICGCTVENGYNYIMKGENISDWVGTIILKQEEKVDNTETKVQEILDLIPNIMTLDIPEIEYKNAGSSIATNIKKILDIKGIKYEVIYKDEFASNVIKFKINDSDVEIYYSGPSTYSNLDEFHSGYVSIYYNVGSGELKEYDGKNIQLIYNNTNKYNTEDEQYVKNLKIENPKCFEVDLDYLLDETVYNRHHSIIENYYTKLINDNSIGIIAIEPMSGGWGPSLNLVSGHGRTNFGIFKNDVLYDIRLTGENITVPVVTVPDTMTDTEINDYVIKLIKDTYSDYGPYVTNITKGVPYNLKQLSDIPYIYTVNFSSTDIMTSVIIIRKEKTVTSSDEKTNIKFETTSTVVPEDTKLVVEEIKEEKTLNTIKETLKEVSDKYVVFDISLVHNDEKIQPNGKVKISIPVPAGYDASKLVVYRIEKDGTKVEFKVEVVEKDNVKYAQFETDHFSNYVLAEKTAEKSEPEDNSNRVLDDQPKTGIFDMKLIIGIVMVAFTVAVVRNKRKKA